MTLVKNYIYSGGHENACGNEDKGECVSNLFGNYYDFATETGAPFFLIRTQEQFDVNKWEGKDEALYILYGEKNSYLLDKSGTLTLKRIKQPEYSFGTETYEYFSVTELQESGYVFVNNKTRDSFKRDEEAGSFLGEYDNCFYFYRFDLFEEINCILKTDFDGNVIETLELKNTAFKSFRGCGRYAFCVEEGSSLKLTALDFEKLDFVGVKTEINDIFPHAYPRNDSTLVFVGDLLLIWDGCTFKKHDFGEKIINHYVDNDIIYMMFVGDPFLYAYDLATLELIVKRRVTKDGYYPFLIQPRGCSLYLDCYSAEPSSSYHSCLTYKVKLNIVEIFNSEDWNVEFEESLVKTETVKDKELFSILLTIDATYEYALMVRHSMSVVSEMVNQHALQFTSEDSTENHSEAFNGLIKIIVNNSSNWSAQRRVDFEQSAVRANEAFGLSLGPANGAHLPLDVTCEFRD